MLLYILSEHSRKKALLTNALGEQWSEEDFLKYCGPYHPQLLKLDSRRRFWVYCRCPKQMESTFWHFLLTHYMNLSMVCYFDPTTKSAQLKVSLQEAIQREKYRQTKWPAILFVSESSATPNNIIPGFKA